MAHDFAHSIHEKITLQIFRRHSGGSNHMHSKKDQESLEEGSVSANRRQHPRVSPSNSFSQLQQWLQLQTNPSVDASGDFRSRLRGVLEEENTIRDGIKRYLEHKGTGSSNTKESPEEKSQSNTRINAKIYRLLIEGDKQGFEEETSGISQLSQVNLGDGNTVLHIAASAGHKDLIDSILSKSSGLIKSRNSEQDTALHVAAKAGQLRAFMSLFNWEVQKETSFEICQEETGRAGCPTNEEEKEVTITKDILKEVDKESNTLLHIVLENQEETLAIYLFKKFPEASTMLNLQGESPIYLAIKGAYWGLVKHMLEGGRRDHVRASLKRGKSIMHAVIKARKKEILDIILEIHPGPIEPFDQGRTPLSYSASIGYLEGVKSLLKHNLNSAFKRDQDGSFPIHKAAGGGHIKVVTEFFSKFKHIRGLLTKQGQNILHVASGNGKHKMVAFLLRKQNPDMEKLINMKDVEGNTPLHLAASGGYFNVVYTLIRDKRVKLALRNRRGLTVIDASEKYDGSLPSFEQRFMWLTLRYAGVPQTPNPHNFMATKGAADQPSGKYMKSISQHQSSQLGQIYEKKVQTLALVAILVVTVTFAAGLAVPGGGGYNDSDHPNRGLATLVKKPAFQAFVICNTIAMYSSILAAITLIWAQLGDAHFIDLSFECALPLLGVSLTFMSAAFMTGTFLLVAHLPWLAFGVLAIGSISLLALLVFSLPLYYYLRLRLVLFLRKKKSNVDYTE